MFDGAVLSIARVLFGCSAILYICNNELRIFVKIYSKCEKVALKGLHFIELIHVYDFLQKNDKSQS